MSTSLPSGSAIVHHSGTSPSYTTLPPGEHRSDARVGLVARHEQVEVGAVGLSPACRVLGRHGWKNRTTIETRELNTGLQTALASRIVIEQAKTIIAKHKTIPVDEASNRLRRDARSRNLRLAADDCAVLARSALGRCLRRSPNTPSDTGTPFCLVSPVRGVRERSRERSRSPRNRRRRRSPGSQPLAPSTARDVQRSSGSSTSAAQLDPNADG